MTKETKEEITEDEMRGSEDLYLLLDEAYEGSYYTIVGAGGSIDEWKEGYQEIFDEEEIGKITKWIEFTGKDMNEKYHLTGDNRYTDSLVFLAFPLDGLDLSKLYALKLRMGDRWFDDIVDNNARREKLANLHR